MILTFLYMVLVTAPALVQGITLNFTKYFLCLNVITEI